MARSVRRPAAYCGGVGYKPSFGTIKAEDGQDLAGADLLPRLGPKFGQHAVGGRADGLLHLHRLQHQDRLARGDHRARFGQHPQDQAGHRGQQRPGGSQLGRIAEPRGLGQRGRAVAGVDVGIGADVVDPVDPPGAVDLQVDQVRAGREDERLQGDAVDLGIDAVPADPVGNLAGLARRGVADALRGGEDVAPARRHRAEHRRLGAVPGLPGEKPQRFSISYHLLALREGAPRVRLQVWVGDGQSVPSVVGVWPTADWFRVR